MNTVFENQSITVNTAVNIDDLADIRNVEIDPTLPVIEKKRLYLKQIKNPNLFRCGDMIVRVSFANTGVTLEERLKQILLSRQGLTL